MSAACGCGPTQNIRDLSVLRKTPLHTFNVHELDVFLKWLNDQPLTTIQRVDILARKNIGQPYKIYLLGEYPYELYDADPMFSLAASDCVTYVEHTYAMALARDWPSFFRVLQRLRYKDGRVGLLWRNHYTEADWNINNAWLFDDVTLSIAEGVVRKMEQMIDRAAFFSRFGLDRDIPVQHFKSEYIDRKRLLDVLPRLHNGDIVEFVRGDQASQFIGHVGLIVHGNDGEVRLLHSAEPAVREEPLSKYIDQHTNILGCKVLRLREGWTPSIWAMRPATALWGKDASGPGSSARSPF